MHSSKNLWTKDKKITDEFKTKKCSIGKQKYTHLKELQTMGYRRNP